MREAVSLCVGESVRAREQVRERISEREIQQSEQECLRKRVGGR